MGKIDFSGFNYFVVLNDTKGNQSWYLFSEIHPKNYAKLGEERFENALTLNKLFEGGCGEYLVESLVRSKQTGKVRILETGGANRLNQIMKAFIDCRDYSYSKDEIMENEVSYEPLPIRQFTARSNSCFINYKTVDGLFDGITFDDGRINLNLTRNEYVKIPKKISYVKDEGTSKLMSSVVSINKINRDELGKITNLDWYLDPVTGKVKKKYVVINTIDEVESKFITPMIRTIQKELSLGITPVIAMDTETSGLFTLYLSEGNVDRSSISTIQFSWAENQGVIIYLDMEYFDNVSIKYVFDRIYKLFRYPKYGDEFDFKLVKDENGNDIDEVVHMKRTSYLLTGHNVIFDERTCLQAIAEVKENLDDFAVGRRQFYFDHDTLQMAFTANPITFKRNKGLKQLERYFFNETPPELVDLLGKGNEGMFRYLSDREVTAIYGCADVDYSRKLFFKLKELLDLIDPKIFKKYSKLDPITWYQAARSEFFGLRLGKEYIRKNTDKINKDMNTIKEFIYSYVGLMVSERTKLLRNGADYSSLTTDDSVGENDDESIFLNESHEEIKKYEFNLAGEEVRTVMYNLLQYPVLVRSRKTGKPAVNKEAIKRLLYKPNDTGKKIMKKDLLSEVELDGHKEVLISADAFNSYKYPLCYALQVYKNLEKEYTTYYKPFDENDLEGRLFKPIKTTNIETRRISCAAQIIKKNLKKAVLSLGDNWYLGDWDLNQVEARVFTSLAGDKAGIERLNDFEKDYHQENAALMNNVPAYLVTKKQRKEAKPYGFGIPYGLSLRSLCESLFTEVTEDNMITTRLLEGKFIKANQMEMDYLDGIRNKALEPVNVPDEVKKFWGVDVDTKIGMVKNEDHFFRYFNLDKALGEKGKENSVKRAAGNFPIQSYAADLYRVLIKRFTDALIDEGIDDKVVFNMYIHDEILFSVHKSIDPRLIAKICAKACMIKIKGHTSYFIGLGFGNSWYEAKNDDNEIPTGMLLRIKHDYEKYTDLRDWTDEPGKFMRPKIDEYKRTRVIEVVEQINGNLETIDYNKVKNNFFNYTVKAYCNDVPLSFPPKLKYKHSTESFEVDNDDLILSHICTILRMHNINAKINDGTVTLTVDDYINHRLARIPNYLEEYSSVKDCKKMKITLPNGEEVKLLDLVAKDNSLSNESDEIIIEDSDDDIEEKLKEMQMEKENQEDNYWSFDANEDLDDFIYSMYDNDRDDEDDEEFKVKRPSYKNLSIMNNVVRIRMKRKSEIRQFEKDFEECKDSGGYVVYVEHLLGTERLRSKYDLNLAKVDDYVSNLICK